MGKDILDSNDRILPVCSISFFGHGTVFHIKVQNIEISQEVNIRNQNNTFLEANK